MLSINRLANVWDPAAQVVSEKHINSLRWLGSGLIDQSQKMTVAAMEMADMKVWAHRS